MVDDPGKHLRVPLRLHVAAHQAEREPGLAVLGDEPGDDRVERPLAGRQLVGVRGVEREQAAAVLEAESEVAGIVPRAEPLEIRLDQADSVEILVDHRHVDRVRRLRLARDRAVVGVVGVHQRGAGPGIWLGDQLGHGDPGEGGVGVIPGAIFVGELLGLDQDVEPLGGVRAHALEVVGLHQVEHLEHGDPLAVRRELPDVKAPVIRRDGLVPRRGMAREVLLGEQAADGLRVGDDGVGDLPFVVGVGPLGGEDAEGLRQPGVLEDLAGARGLSAGEERRRRARHLCQAAGRGAPGRGDQLADGETLLGIRDRRREQLRERPGAEPGAQRVPPADASGHRPRQRPLVGDLGEPLGLEEFERRCERGASAGIQAVQGLGLGVPDDGEQVAADAVGGRLDQAEDGIRGDRGVDGVAPVLQDADRRGGRQRLARRGHPVPRHDGRPCLVDRPRRPVGAGDLMGPAQQRQAGGGDRGEGLAETRPFDHRSFLEESVSRLGSRRLGRSRPWSARPPAPPAWSRRSPPPRRPRRRPLRAASPRPRLRRAPR